MIGYIYNENMRVHAEQLATRQESINLARVADPTSVLSVDGIVLELAYHVAASQSKVEMLEWLSRLDAVVDDTIELLADELAADEAVLVEDDSE